MIDSLTKIKDSVIEFFSSKEKTVVKTKYDRSYTNINTRQNLKSYTSTNKQNFLKSVQIFKKKESKRLNKKYDVCSTLFYPSKFRASYSFVPVREYPKIEQLNLKLVYVETELKELEAMEKAYAK